LGDGSFDFFLAIAASPVHAFRHGSTRSRQSV